MTSRNPFFLNVLDKGYTLIHALIELVNDGVLTIEKAAEKASMSAEEFGNAMKKAYAQE